MEDLVKDHGIVLMDGECNFCNGFANFVMKRDPTGYFKFGAQQGESARPIMEHWKIPLDLKCIVLIDTDKKVYKGSTAVLRVAKYLTLPWWLGYYLTYIPECIREPVYNLIAANRYRIAGKRECRRPTKEERQRFI